jgi:hypothetical protein
MVESRAIVRKQVMEQTVRESFHENYLKLGLWPEMSYT